MNELALFAGAGGGILGGRLLGWRTICAVEWDARAAGVLVARQNDGCLEPFPVWDDVQTFDGRPWAGSVDVVSGGFPCTDISSAGKGAGLDGAASGLWREMARIVGEVRPRFVFVENSPMLTVRGLGTVLGDLAALGFDAAWRVLSASQFGAPHQRERIWIVAANPDAGGMRAPWPAEDQAGPAGLHFGGAGTEGRMASWWHVEPEPCSVAYGVAGVVDELRPFGNGQVPIVAAAAFRMLADGLRGDGMNARRMEARQGRDPKGLDAAGTTAGSATPTRPEADAGSAPQGATPKAPLEARRWCNGDGEWSNWQPCTQEQAKEYRERGDFEIRAATGAAP